MRRGIVALICLIGAVWLVAAVGTAVAAPPPNDNFADVQVLSGTLPIDVTGTTVEATREAGEPLAAEATPSGHSAWFRWEPTSTGYVSVGACGSEERVNLAVYTGSSVGALTEVSSTRFSTAPDCAWNDRTITFTAHVGTVYSIAVEGDGLASPYLDPQSGEGPIQLHLSEPTPPAHDEFVDALPIPDGGGSFPIDNHGATKQSGEPAHQGNPGGASVWFEWTAPYSGGAFFQGCELPIAGKAVVGVYTGATVSSLTPVPSIETMPSCDFMFFANAGVTYRIAFDGVFVPASSAAEMFNTVGSLRQLPGNDDFENALEVVNPFTGVPAMQLSWAGPSTVGATKQPGEPNHAGDPGRASVWFEWTAPVTGSVQMKACHADFPTLFAVYTGDTLDSLTPVASGTGVPNEPCTNGPEATGEVGFNTHEGITYDIAVDGAGGAWGKFEFDLWASNERLKREAVKKAATPAAPPAVAGVKPVAPKTKITARHVDRSNDSVTLRLGSDLKGSTFRCKLDKGKFAKCGAKVTYRHLAPGPHTFEAEAVGPSGIADATPAKAKFTLAKHRPKRHH
jgi:hypothetical protein